MPYAQDLCGIPLLDPLLRSDNSHPGQQPQAAATEKALYLHRSFVQLAPRQCVTGKDTQLRHIDKG